MLALRASPETMLSDLLFEQAGVGLCLVGPDGTALRANDEWLRSTGFSPGQVIGKDVIELFPDTRELAAAIHARARNGEKVVVPPHPVEIQGRRTWWEGSISPVEIDGGTGILISARDITEHVARGREPGDLDALYHALFEHSPDGVLLTRPDGTVVRANPAACAMFGLSEADVCELGREARLVDDAASRAYLAQRERNGVAKAQLTQRRGDGSLFPAEVTSAVITTRHGESYTYVIFRDITERARAEGALRESERRLALALEGSDDGSWNLDLAANRFTFSDRVFEMAGEQPRGPMSSPDFWWERVHPEDVRPVQRALGAHLRGKTRRIDVEYRLRHSDGSWRWVRALGFGVEKDARGRPTRLAGTLRDLTERREARDRLQAALAENETLVAELRDALQNVKTLSGLLPVCAWCHKIRNDSGYWQKLETYVAQHSDATFTHGMCPECFDRHSTGMD